MIQALTPSNPVLLFQFLPKSMTLNNLDEKLGVFFATAIDFRQLSELTTPKRLETD